MASFSFSDAAMIPLTGGQALQAKGIALADAVA